MITGSLGMLPSASLASGGMGLYEPVHGSAPDIAGQGKANPIACILSFAMALRYSFDADADADSLETAIKRVLAGGSRTADIMEARARQVSTTEMCDAILTELEKSGA